MGRPFSQHSVSDFIMDLATIRWDDNESWYFGDPGDFPSPKFN